MPPEATGSPRGTFNRRRTQFASLGSTIVTLGSPAISPFIPSYLLLENIGGVLLNDTKTTTITATSHIHDGLIFGYKAAMAAENRLHMINSKTWWDDSGSLLCPTEDPGSTNGDKVWDWHPFIPSSSWCWG